MNTIICCVNRTQVNPSVLIRQTLRLAQYFESSVIFTKIFDEDLQSSNKDQSDSLSDLRSEIDNYLGKEHSNIPITCTIAYGDLLKQIEMLSKEERADLVILGTNREGFWHRVLFGDNSIDMAQRLDCPVLLLPIVDSEFAIKRIVYSAQLVYDNLNSLSKLKLWASALKAKIYCIHVIDEEKDKVKAIKKMNELKSYFGDDGFDYIITAGDLIDSIAQQTLLAQSDLIVSLHRRRNWWAKILKASSSKNIYKQLKVPMLFFKE